MMPSKPRLKRRPLVPQLQRISFTQTEVGMMNDIVDYLIKQGEDIKDEGYISRTISRSVTTKGEMLKKLLGEGVIE